MSPQREQLYEELARRLAAALRSAQLYSNTHPLTVRHTETLGAVLDQILADEPSVVIGFVGDEVIAGGVPLPRVSELMQDLLRRLKAAGIERVTIDRGVARRELAALAETVARMDVKAEDLSRLMLPHIRVGQILVRPPTETARTDVGVIRQLYAEAVTHAQDVWDSTSSEGQPDPGVARRMVEQLAEVVAERRPTLLALTALKSYDNYTFTHMVNVSILTMAQARGLGIEGRLLQEMGQAALLHDIGKVRTPGEILNKAEKLTADEFAVMKRHVVDGAEILLRTPDMTALAPVVAFEHHLRLDGSGYPEGVSRAALNLGTMLCSIADVYDAMRSQRVYHGTFPTDRILAMLRSNDGRQFDQHLVRRFAQLIGIYPPGNLVQLNTGEVGVVLRVHAPDPHRPSVRVLFGRNGDRLAQPLDVRLWEQPADESITDRPARVAALVDPARYNVDPLLYMDRQD